MDLMEREVVEAILEMPSQFTFAEKQACIEHSITGTNVPTIKNFTRCVICEYYESINNQR